VVCFVSANHTALGAASHEHALKLSIVYEKDNEDIRSSLGIVLVKFTGEDIYNARCSACHLFDQKKVGPPYQTVIPKYQGKKAQLISFILNPQKINPAYPSMPNQGLKPAEADSIATFLMHKTGVHP
jgi:cytochrome c